MVNEKMSELESASSFPLESLHGKVDVAVEEVRLEKRKSASRKVNGRLFDMLLCLGSPTEETAISHNTA